MTPTPFLKPFNEQGGTLYVFPSVSRDLTRTVVSGDYEFSFSHFACLNLPDILSGDFGEDSDTEARAMYISTLLPSDRKLERRAEGWSTLGMGYAITENLQNYVMNFETAILNGEGDNDDYDPDILTTVSEKIFWNWLEKIGAIKFNETGTEEDYGSYNDRVVQYIGNIDVMNTVTVNGDSFEELYIHVPSTAGASTSVYFRPGAATDNKNYLLKNYSVANGNMNPEYIIGRENESRNIYDSNISIKAIYDIDEGSNIYVGDMGHTIDFRDSSYDGGEGISNMNNKSLEDFEFNAVLIYYDLLEKTSVPGVKRKATNLYGILFLDNVQDDIANYNPETQTGVRQGHFQRYPKKKETVYGNGNSYALKVDLKIDTIGDATVDYRVVEDPNNPASMAIYAKSLTQLQNCIDVFFSLKNEIVKLTERVATLENMMLGIDSISHMKQDINRLYDLCDGNNLVDTGALLGLIDANTRKLENIMNGGKDIKLQFDTDVIQPGNGIGIKKSLNKVVISSEQKYSVNTVYDGLMTNETEISQAHPIDTLAAAKLCTIPLKPGENFAVIYINDNGDSPSNLNINISEENYQWEVGQSLKLYFICGDGGYLKFENDSLGIVIKVKDGISLYVPGWEFEGNNLIEVVCVALSDTSDNGNVNENKFIYLIK